VRDPERSAAIAKNVLHVRGDEPHSSCK
jgi:hypothetical protein